jgi:YD repeat-containing protein
MNTETIKPHLRGLFLPGLLCVLFLAPPITAQAEQVTHSYDDLNRLISSVYADGTVIGYSYDAAGNRTGQTVTPKDTDGDGVPDQTDNCTLVSNANQRDTDQDGFGNICDPDFNQNKIVDPADFSSLKLKLGKVSPNHDLNGNGIVDPADVSILKTYLGKSPGPAGLVK